jgi:CBS domain-containing protein
MDTAVTTPQVTAGTLMSRPLATIDHAATVREAAEQLAADCIGALVVLHGTALVGVLSERDIVAHVAVGADLDHLTVGEVMQADVVTTTSDVSVRDAAVTMVRADVRHLPVMVGDRVEGMLSVRDVLASLTGSAPSAT